MFSVHRPCTLELGLPRQLQNLRQPVTREEIILAIGKVLGSDMRTFIKCIQVSNSGYSCRVTFKEGSDRQREQLFIKGIYIRGCFCFLNGVESPQQVVTVSNLPCEVNDDDIKEFFEKYGEVNQVVRNFDKYGLETGDRRLFMSLNEHIPSSVLLDPYVANVKYRSQPLCCFSCNWWGHSNTRCPLKHCCTRCGAKNHHSFRCSKSLIEPPSYALDRTDAYNFPPHPVVSYLDKLRSSEESDEGNKDNENPDTQASSSSSQNVETTNNYGNEVTEEIIEEREECSSQSLFPNPPSQDSLQNTDMDHSQSSTSSSFSWSSPSFSHVLQYNKNKDKNIEKPPSDEMDLHFTNMFNLKRSADTSNSNSKNSKNSKKKS